MCIYDFQTNVKMKSATANIVIGGDDEDGI